MNTLTSKRTPVLISVTSHTKFLGMKPDKRAGYILYCQGDIEYLMIMHPDEAMTVQMNDCLVFIFAGGSCEEMWELDVLQGEY